MTLAAWSLGLVPWFVEAGSLKLVAVDQDPRAMSGPSIAHDLELQGYGAQLLWRRVTYFYCEFFHISFIVVQAQGALRLITSEPTWANNDLTNLSSGKSLNELRLHPIISGTGCQA